MGYRRHNYRGDIAGPTWLYKLYDETPRLVYVGVSSDPANRMVSHRRKPWWSLVKRVEFRWCPSRMDAFAAEKAAMIAEDPLHNIALPREVLRAREAANV